MVILVDGGYDDLKRGDADRPDDTILVISDFDGNAVIRPMPTNLKIEDYKNWLDEGIKSFNSGNK